MFRLVVAMVAAGIVSPRVAAQMDQQEVGMPGDREPINVLICEPAGPRRAELSLLVLNTGRGFADDGNAQIAFRATGDPEARIEGEQPGPRTVTVPVAFASWAPGQVELVRFREFEFGAALPERLDVLGAVAGEQLRLLGRLTREGDAIALHRAPPPTRGDEQPVAVLAAVEPLGDSGFMVKLGFVNYGARFEVDLWAFVHFELEPTGENPQPHGPRMRSPS